MLRVETRGGLQRRLGQPALQIGIEIENEFRLRSIAFENLVDRLQVAERGLDDFGADASGQGLGTHFRQPGVEWWRRFHRRNGRRFLGGNRSSDAQNGRNKERGDPQHNPF